MSDPPTISGMFKNTILVFAQVIVQGDLVITLILGDKRNEHYNDMSVIMKCTF